MKFSIITTTFKQQKQIFQAVLSLQHQTHKDWEMIIINDSPKDTTYHDFASSINDHRIQYHVNEVTRGTNYSKNIALEKISADSRWVIFLSDNNYLSPDALATFSKLIMLHEDAKWFVTNNALKNGVSLTHFPRDETFYSYTLSCLFLRRSRRGATHCIETKLITHSSARFSKYVKQEEEWFFLYQIGLRSKLFYFDHNSTISDENKIAPDSLFQKKTASEIFESTTQLLYEGADHGLLKHPTFLFAIFIRYLELIITKK